VVAIEDAAGSVPGDLHGDSLRHALVDHVPPYPCLGMGRLRRARYSSACLLPNWDIARETPSTACSTVSSASISTPSSAQLGRRLCRLSALAHLKLAPGPDTPGPAPPQLDHTAGTP
jgi:hypothetical protein